MGRTYRKDGLVDRRRAHARVRLRARALERPRGPSASSASATQSRSTTTTGTWNAYGNQYWPAEYLIDRRGHVRYAHFGEGDYEHTENLIRGLLSERDLRLPGRTRVSADAPEGALTPETYLGWERISIRYAGSPIAADRLARYDFPRALDEDGYAYAGVWRVARGRIVAGPRARLEIRFYARKAHLVLGGRGTVDVLLDGSGSSGSA